MKKIFLLFVLFLLPLTAHSQFLWHIVHTDYDKQNYYCFDAISCSGNICTAAGRLIDVKNERIYRLFWRSTNGGITWEIQDPGLPPDSNLRSEKNFTVIQQIDSLNAVAAGIGGDFYPDSVVLLRTFDGGKSWQKQGMPMWGVPRNVYFSDSLHGIFSWQENDIYQGATAPGYGRERIFSTTDGGRNWDSVAFNIDSHGHALRLSVFCSGNGSFKVFIPYYEKLYTTTNNWKSVDSSVISYDSRYFFGSCNFSGDTIIAYGGDTKFDTTQFQPLRDRACIARSFDNGKNWEKLQIFPGTLWFLEYMTSLDRDTVLAGGESENKILMSTDKGATWKIDSLIIFDTAYGATGMQGLTFTLSGNPLAIITGDYGLYTPSIIARGQYIRSSVNNYSGRLAYHRRTYPNPATSTLNIISVEAASQYKIVDVMGRTVLSGMVPDHDILPLDVSGLPRGVYYVLVENADIKNRFEIVGKVALVAY